MHTDLSLLSHRILVYRLPGDALQESGLFCYHATALRRQIGQTDRTFPKDRCIHHVNGKVGAVDRACPMSAAS